MAFKVPEQFRVTTGLYGSDASFGNCGTFNIIIKNPVAKNPKKPGNVYLYAMASDDMDWEHVSVSLMDGSRLPTHAEMEAVKTLFWGDDCYVMELHPPASEYVNHAPVLHLWRPIKQEIPVPPSIMVGVR